MADRGQFLLDYIEMLQGEGLNEAAGFRHSLPGASASQAAEVRRLVGRARWVVNKVRALGSWYTKGLEGGATLRVRINSAESIDSLKQLIHEFFGMSRVLSYSQHCDYTITR